MIYSSGNLSWSQHSIQIEANISPEVKTVHIKQKIEYHNTSNDTLKVLYFNDWTSSFSSSTTSLATRFIEEFEDNLFTAKSKDRGYTQIESIQDSEFNAIEYQYLNNQSDILEVSLTKPIYPNTTTVLNFDYSLIVQNDKFTAYGVNKNQEFALNYWYITPAVYENSQWQLFSNKNLGDYYTPNSTIELNLNVSDQYHVISELELSSKTVKNKRASYQFFGKNRTDSRLFITKTAFKSIQIDSLEIVTNYHNKNINDIGQVLVFDKVIQFLNTELLSYPHSKLLLSEIDTKKTPIYGLNILPDFLTPFSKQFEYELTIAKNLIQLHVDQLLVLNPRKEHWLRSGFETLLLMKYVEQFYPDQKIIGKLSKLWGLRIYNISKLNYNEQYRLSYAHMARIGRDQALNSQNDALVKFNETLSSKYKAALGLLYLDDYIGRSSLYQWMTEFIKLSNQKPIYTSDFKSFIKSKTTKNIDWFFDDYLTNSKQVDYKITKVKSTKDSIVFNVKNKKSGTTPISLYTLKDTLITSKIWLENIGEEKRFSIPNNQEDRLILNFEQKIPEFNFRNNFKSLSQKSVFNKPFQIRLFKDVEAPNYNQLYLNPIVEFRNIYDGLTLGATLNNNGLLRKSFIYGISPNYSVNSKSLTGYVKLVKRTYFEDQPLYNINYGVSLWRSTLAENVFLTKFEPYLNFYFRVPFNLRSNAFKRLSFRFISINKTQVQYQNGLKLIPSYDVFNVNYRFSNNEFVKFKNWFLDAQFSKTFGKIALKYEVRQRNKNNFQYNLRLYAGSFLYNTTPSDVNNFNFALDRPNDYLIEYNYLGQYESTGIFSQQVILAEGGFKSKLNTGYANQWITTLNGSASIWKYVQAYGDIGFIKNKYQSPEFVYDSGVRLNLITDYLEVYFPFYSNLGWEISHPQYSQKIRFILTADPFSILELFRRKWY
ncbi:metalloprotease [Flavobacteriaceae bacterium]|nr:metalloprotease [Flavobacteriaceae bacterium]MDB4182755.1 metalloprotease [Flavobacteriaceae bacterium]